MNKPSSQPPVFSALAIVTFYPGVGHPAPYVVSMLFVISLFWLVPLRFGLLSLMPGYTFEHLLGLPPLTFDLTAWYGYVTWLTLLFTIGIAIWGFKAALADRPLFRDEILEGEAPLRH